MRETRSSEVAVLVTHFSTYGAEFGTTHDLATFELEIDRTERQDTAFVAAIDSAFFATLYPRKTNRSHLAMPK